MDTFNTTSQDWFNQIAQNVTSNALIQYVLKSEGEIDYQLLKKSVLLSIQAEPILGCLFVEKEKMPLWKSIPINPHDVCCRIKTQKIEEEITLVLKKELNASQEPPIKVYLFDDGCSNVVVIKINHSVCDGSGSKYIVKLIANIYTRLEKDDSFVPKENTPVRDTKNLYKVLKIKDIAGYFNSGKAELSSTWGFPVGEEMFKQQTFSCRQLRYENDDFQQLKKFAKEQDVTLNTLLTAAYFYALVKELDPGEATKELQFMLDLRKYLPADKIQNICNLSAILNVELPTEINDFQKFIKQTGIAMEDILNTDSFIHGTIAGDLSEESGYQAIKESIKSDWRNIQKTGNCTPMISNFGILDTGSIYFGKTKIKDMYLVSPAFFAPAFMLAISTYNNILTINASYYSPGIKHQ